jgi:MT0933-like antitoxin protein
MSSLDDIANQAKGLADKVQDLAAEHPDQLESALDKIGDVVNDKTSGKFSGQIDQAEESVLGRLKADDKA